MDCVIGCDVGSQSTKAVLLTWDGRVLGEASSGYGIQHPHAVWAEQPAEWWITALIEAVRGLLAQTGVPRSRVRALALASQVEGVVATDAAGRPLRPAIIWMDRRATEPCERVRRAVGDEAVFRVTGLNLDASHVAPKIRWIADHQPELYARAACFHQPGSYMAYYLTGHGAIDYSNASASLLMDIRARRWSPYMCEQFGIAMEKLPPIGPSTALLGRLRRSAAEALGLSTDTLVMIGSGDEHAACLGAGIVQSGLVGDIAGTAEPVCAAADGPAFDSTGLVETHCHADPGLWLLENPGFVSGINYRWYRDQFGSPEVRAAAGTRQTAYELLDSAAGGVPAGAEGLIFLPCLMGAMTPTWNEAARGTFFGFTLAHTRAHFARAILEGSAYGVRAITDRMRAIGLDLSEMRVMGGGARSRLWNQIKADVTGLPVGVPRTTETTALGAALIALVGVGAYASLAEACGEAVQIVERFEPRPETRAAYDEAYALFHTVYFSLLPAFDQAARVTT